MGRPLTGLAMPFEGLWLPVQLLFYAAFVVIVVVLLWTTILFVLSIQRVGPASD